MSSGSAGDLRRRQELASFLRHCRRSVDPATVGLPHDPRRRLPGLRREEVAVLSGVGVTWYTWLEQARAVNPSPEVIDALSRTLRLNEDARDHLRRLAQLPPASRPHNPTPPRQSEDLLAALHPSAAYISDDHWNILAWNAAEAVLLPELATVPEQERNVVWLLFTAESPRATMPDWEPQARNVVSQLRAQHGGRLDDKADAALLERLQGASEKFRQMWAGQDVTGFSTHERRFNHPQLGPLRLHQHKLRFVDRPNVLLTVYTPADSHTHEAMARST